MTDSKSPLPQCSANPPTPTPSIRDAVVILQVFAINLAKMPSLVKMPIPVYNPAVDGHTNFALLLDDYTRVLQVNEGLYGFLHTLLVDCTNIVNIVRELMDERTLMLDPQPLLLPIRVLLDKIGLESRNRCRWVVLALWDIFAHTVRAILAHYVVCWTNERFGEPDITTVAVAVGVFFVADIIMRSLKDSDW